jgi:hypothetical protein
VGYSLLMIILNVNSGKGSFCQSGQKGKANSACERSLHRCNCTASPLASMPGTKIYYSSDEED